MNDAQALAILSAGNGPTVAPSMTDAQALSILSPDGGPQSVPQPLTPSSGIDSPTHGMSAPQLFAAGIGKGAMDLFRGARNAVTDVLAGPPFAPQELKDLAAQWRQQSDQIKAQDAPLMKSGWANAGDITAQMLPAFAVPLGELGAWGRIGASAGMGALQGAVQPVGVNDSRGVNMALGAGLGAVGQGVANGIGAVARGAVPANAQVQAAQDFANANGGVLTRGQISGSPWMQRIEKMAASLPGSSGFYKGAAAANAKAVNAGIDAVTGGNAGALIQNAGAGRMLNFDQPFFADMGNIGQNFAGLADRDAPNGALKTVEQYIGSQTPNPALAGFSASAKAQAIAQGVPEFIGGTVPKFQVGDAIPMVGPYGDFNNYQALRSLYGQRAQVGDAADKAAYGLVQDAFDNTAQRSLAAQGTDPSTMKAVQQAYAVQKIAQPARVVDADGNVSYNPTKLAGAVERTDARKPGMIDNLGTAGQQLRQVAAFGRVATPVSSSGTAEGNIAGHVLTGGMALGAAGGGLGEYLSGGALHHLGLGIMGLMTMPKLVNTAIQGTRYGIPLLRDASPTVQNTLLRAGTALPLGSIPYATGLLSPGN